MEKNGVSIITVTNRFFCLDNIIRNYDNQNIDNKELIIIINSNNIDSERYNEYCYSRENVSLYIKPENITLGECLNYAISKSKFNMIAKFDDDDYYGPYYLLEAISLLSSSAYNVVGKIKTFYYLDKYKSLYLSNNGFQNQSTKTVMGSTLCFNKTIFDKTKFRHVDYKEDFLFNRDCIKNGFNIYASSCNNHIVYKFKDNNLHTWKCDIDYLLKHSTLIKSNIEFDQCFSIVDKTY